MTRIALRPRTTRPGRFQPKHPITLDEWTDCPVNGKRIDADGGYHMVDGTTLIPVHVDPAAATRS